MSWRRMAPHVYSAAKATATGASITFGSTVVSCYLAIQIEAASHRALFSCFPHWYENVEQANGIHPDLLASARMEARRKREEEERTQQLLLKLAAQKELDAATKKKEDRTKTIFTVERFVEPARRRVQELSSFQADLGACAMTA